MYTLSIKRSSKTLNYFLFASGSHLMLIAGC